MSSYQLIWRNISIWSIFSPVQGNTSQISIHYPHIKNHCI